MGGLLAIDTLCDNCQNKTDIVADRDLALNWDTLYTCDICGERGVRRVWSLPNTTKESYVDGHKRGGDYQLLKEAAKVTKQAASATGKTKSELLKAANELRSASKNERKK